MNEAGESRKTRTWPEGTFAFNTFVVVLLLASALWVLIFYISGTAESLPLLIDQGQTELYWMKHFSHLPTVQEDFTRFLWRCGYSIVVVAVLLLPLAVIIVLFVSAARREHVTPRHLFWAFVVFLALLLSILGYPQY